MAATRRSSHGPAADSTRSSCRVIESPSSGRVGARIIDPRSPETTKSLALGIDLTRLAVDGTGRLLATADTNRIDSTLGCTPRRADRRAPARSETCRQPVPIRFSADGHYLLVSGAEQTTWVNVSTADWPHIACSLVTDPLSPDEQRPIPGITRRLGALPVAHLRFATIRRAVSTSVVASRSRRADRTLSLSTC